MYFRLLHDHTSGELKYLLVDPDAQEAVLIDPRGRDLPVLRALLATPGHIAGCLSFAWRDRLFFGDLLAIDLLMSTPSNITIINAGFGALSSVRKICQRNAMRQMILPSSRLFHWTKRWFDGTYLRKYR